MGVTEIFQQVYPQQSPIVFMVYLNMNLSSITLKFSYDFLNLFLVCIPLYPEPTAEVVCISHV